MYDRKKDLPEALRPDPILPEESTIHFSPSVVREFMGGVNRALHASHRLPQPDSETANAVIANYIAIAQEEGDLPREYDGWAAFDHLTDQSMAYTNSARIAVNLDKLTRDSRYKIMLNGEEFATAIHDYSEEKLASEEVDEDLLLESQMEEIQDRILALKSNGVITQEKAFGFMLLVEVAKPSPSADEDTIKLLRGIASRELRAQLFNQQVRTPSTKAVELLLRHSEPNHKHKIPSHFLNTFRDIFPSESYETATQTYLRYRETLMKGIEELYGVST